ncbi:MAG: c-type cytochrome [Gammaproteobacteria bacterium]|nr:c-type cytochrome [Pseudomonadales bacterium]MCP5348192.1 c-type cytochrome [Pseudomonadales bacterium]
MKTLIKTLLLAGGIGVLTQPATLLAQQFSQLDTTFQSIGNQVCATCHGAYGQGNPVVGGPSLAGLEPWYLRSQLEKFRAGWRGAQRDYIPAYEMQATVSNISNAEIDRLVSEVTSWPEPDPEAYSEGNAAHGQQLYTTCATCHGMSAEGNEALKAPALADRDSWYLYRQLNLFKSGFRGGHPDDVTGAQMRASVQVLEDDQAVKDVVAYINSLN